MKKQQWEQLGDRFAVAGIQYSDYQRVQRKIKLGDQVRFIGEPRNPFDRMAIRIEYKETRIGYVPRGTNIQKFLWHTHNKGAIIIGVVTFITESTLVIGALAKNLTVTKEQSEVLFSKLRDELSYQYRG